MNDNVTEIDFAGIDKINTVMDRTIEMMQESGLDATELTLLSALLFLSNAHNAGAEMTIENLTRLIEDVLAASANQFKSIN